MLPHTFVKYVVCAMLFCMAHSTEALAGNQHKRIYGAIAISPSTMNYAATNGEFSQERAELIAMEHCANSSDKPQDCEIAVWFYDSCGSLATKEGENAAWGGDWGRSTAQAQSKALQQCQKFTQDKCKVELTICTKNFD